MSKKNAMATIANLHNVHRVLKKVKMNESGVCYGCVEKKEELKLIGIGDASFKTSEKAVGITILLLVNEDLTRASPIHWISKQIERVCQSSKDLETLTMNRLVEDAAFAAKQNETLLFG